MPGIRFEELAERFVADLERYGATVVVQGAVSTRPLRCRVTLGDDSANLEVYLWTVTTGGRGRGRPDERRIQMTGIDRFRLRAGVRTLVGGWSAEVGVYAFWDVRRHQDFTPGSSSLQIDLNTLERAYHHGFATETRQVREGEEISTGVQADYLYWYIQEWERLYECGAEIDTATELIDAPGENEREFIDSGDDDAQRSRRHKVVSVVQHFRDARFRPLVLRAYGFRCCVTGVALRLVDAAHIVPVTDPTSQDEVWNGLALAASVHRAYDTGLLGILPGGRLSLSPTVRQRLKRDHLSDGLDAFRESLPTSIRLPASTESHPRDEALMRGLTARGWTDSEIEDAMRGRNT